MPTAARAQRASVTTGPTGVERAGGDARLTGWRLVVARAVALGVCSVTVCLGVYALVLWPRLIRPCEDALNSCLMTSEQAATLSRLGVSPAALTLALVLLNCVVIALANGVAALLFWRRSDDAMALLVAVTLVLMPAFFTPMFQALPGIWHEIASVVNGLGGVSFLLLVLLFPSGHFAPRWSWAPSVAVVVFFITIGSRLPTAVVVPVIFLWILTLIGGQIHRYRQSSSPVQRQQTKWAVTGIVLAIALNQLFWQPDAWIPALQRKDSLYPLLLYPDFDLIIATLAICFGVAVLRYRLYDVDLIIRRTLIYGVSTSIVGALYFAIVIGAQAISRPLTGTAGSQQVVIVATTLLIAAIFAPLRRIVQATIDRAFYRSAYDSAAMLTAFGARLRTETDLEALCGQLVEAVERAMQPEQIHLWLRSQTPTLGEEPPGSSASVHEPGNLDDAT